MEKIKNWYRQNFYLDNNYEEAFRIADTDFDGNVSKEDLKNFLIHTLRIIEEEVSKKILYIRNNYV